MTGPLQTAKPLRGPDDLVRVSAREYTAWNGFTNIEVEYVGPSLPALVDAGCITQAMADSFTVEKKPGKGRLDEHGNRYWRKPARCAAQPERVIIIRCIMERDFALSLPGVRENLIDDTDEACAPTRQPARPHDATVRARTVGPRRVSWTADGNVITPDWPLLRAATAAWREARA
jgi:hypothetical protein